MSRTRLRSLTLALAAVLAGAMAWLAMADTAPAPSSDGIVRIKSAYGVDETIDRLKADIATKGIKFFLAVDQSQLGAEAGIPINRSTLLLFGNPPLGIQFLSSNPNAGLDWPVHLLVTEDNDHQVWAAYTDFSWIARRHKITDRDAQFKMASSVVASITSAIAK